MMSRSHSGTTDAYGWKEANHSSLMAPYDQVHSKSSRQFLLETEGNQIPMVRYNGSSKSERETTYNVFNTRTEKIVEHNSTVPAAPLINMHRLPPEDHDQYSNRRDFGVDDEDHRHRSRHPARPDSDVNHHDRRNNYPDKKFEEFINRVRDEAQRRGTTTTTTNKPAAVAVPFTSNWRSVPKNNNNAGSGHSLSKPTNQVSTAMEFPKEAIKPFNGKEKEIVGLINNSSAYIDSTPAAVPKSSTSDPYSHQVTSTAPGKKKGPAAPEKEITGLINNSSAYTDSRPAAVAKSSTSDPYSHQIATTAPGKKKGPAAPEKIDSREATRRYGKLLSRSTTDEEEYEHQGIITSREALKKYNGVFVP